jgi:FixJ family two-component response regulator
VTAWERFQDAAVDDIAKHRTRKQLEEAARQKLTYDVTQRTMRERNERIATRQATRSRRDLVRQTVALAAGMTSIRGHRGQRGQ